MPVACIVHQHVDRPNVRFRLGHHAGYRADVGNVQQHGVRSVTHGFESAARLIAADGADYAVAGGKRFARKRQAKATADAGDEKGLAGHGLPPAQEWRRS